MEFLPVEPRLFSKLRPRFRDMLVDQRAKSVEFELIRAIIACFKHPTEDQEISQLAREKLAGFLTAKDPNRKSDSDPLS